MKFLAIFGQDHLLFLTVRINIFYINTRAFLIMLITNLQLLRLRKSFSQDGKSKIGLENKKKTKKSFVIPNKQCFLARMTYIIDFKNLKFCNIF